MVSLISLIRACLWPPRPDGTEILFGRNNLSEQSSAPQKDWRDSRAGTGINEQVLLYKLIFSRLEICFGSFLKILKVLQMLFFISHIFLNLAD